jgi:tetratricopeptide (TPR) repeat protein
MVNPDQARTLIEEGRRLRAAGDRAACLNVFKEAARSEPSNVTAFVECGYEYLHLKQIPDAHAAFDLGLTLEPDNKAALIGLGHTLRHLRQLEDAERTFRRALELEPDHAGANVGLGQTLRSMNRQAHALEAFQAALRTNPKNTNALIETAHLLHDLGRQREAISMLGQAVVREPLNLSYLATLAWLLKQTGNSADSLQLYRKLVAADPSNLNWRLELGHRLLETEALDEARDVLNAVSREMPENISALSALGWVNHKAKRFDLAADSFQKVLALQPTNVGALRALGTIARERGEYEVSLRFLICAKQYDPKALYVRLEICNSLRKLQRFSEAIKEYGEILAEWPVTRDAHLGLGYALRSVGRMEEALSSFEQASQDDLSHPNAAIEAGYLLLSLGRPVDAERRFRKALERTPGNAEALVGLSHALRKLAWFEPAETALRQVLVEQPSHVGAIVSLGHLFADQYRFDEALPLFEALLAQAPDHAGALAALGNIHRRRNDREAALSVFQRAADVDPDNPDRLIDVAIEMRDLGRVQEAVSVLDSILAKAPTDAKALLQRGLLLRCEDRRNDALHAFTELIAHHPNHAQAMVEAAIEERALGRLEAARERLGHALGTETDHLGALLQLGEISIQSDDPHEAIEFYRRATSAHPNNVWSWIGGARAAFENGQCDRAFQLIRDARERLGPLPEIAGLELEFLRHLRNWGRAQKLLDEAMTKTNQNFWLWSQKVQLATAIGNYGAAASELVDPPASSASDRAMVALLRGQLAEAQFEYEPAIAQYREAIRINPGDAWAHFELSRAALMNLDLESSRAALAKFVQVSRSSLLLKKQSLSPSQNHVGQLIDEFVLDTDALATLRRIRLHPLDSQFEPLRKLIEQHPDYTPAAMIATIALRQHGDFAPRTGSEITSSAIPRLIVQFWDDDPPEDVRRLMASWQELNPGYTWTCFNDEKAQAFLENEFGREILGGYRRAPLPAQKADIFRLACLVARGGIYADADDSCLAPIDSFLRPEATLVVHQENYGSIGNNFIAATPEHPVLTRALELGAAAMQRGDHDLVWLSTGPGLLTRALAQEWAAGRPGGLLRRTQIMHLGEIQRVIGIHCPVRYKSTHRHWSRSSFGRIKRRA